MHLLSDTRAAVPAGGETVRRSGRGEASKIRVVARCPGRSITYEGGGRRFLYSDEYGSYCLDFGDLLSESAGDFAEESRPPYWLIIPKGLEGTELHRRLERLAGEDGAPVLVSGPAGACQEGHVVAGGNRPLRVPEHRELAALAMRERSRPQRSSALVFRKKGCV